MKDVDIENWERAQKLLAAARMDCPAPSPFLKTRVLAGLRAQGESRQRNRQLRWWKSIAILSPAVSLAVVALFYFSPANHSHPLFHAKLNEVVAIRVEVEPLSGNEGVSFAEVELPEGVHFYSKRFNELQDQRSLRVAWDNTTRRQLPLAVESSTPGLKKVLVHFLNAEQKTIETREIEIDFEKGAV